jgi:hypothetical protein
VLLAEQATGESFDLHHERVDLVPTEELFYDSSLLPYPRNSIYYILFLNAIQKLAGVEMIPHGTG